MSIYIGIDFGTKRTGIATSDPTHLIASALDTVSTELLMNQLEQIIQQDSIVGIVVGAPLRWSGEASAVESQIESWISRFKDTFPEIPVYREDERFTSKIAQQSLLQGGVKKSKRKDKKLLDSMSAALILQSFLDRQNRPL
ncbi:MAG: Holliday junction resolvase RuvX [Flavobacteriaceae bacterium]